MTTSTTLLSVHVAGIYQTDGFLAERVASFITEGLTAGEQVIVLATTEHWTAISVRLNASGLEFRRASQRGDFCCWMRTRSWTASPLKAA